MEKKVELNNLNEDEVVLSEEELQHVNGGAVYYKLTDVKGEVASFDKSTPYLANKSSPVLFDRLL